jgi:hypothetical protein
MKATYSKFNSISFLSVGHPKTSQQLVLGWLGDEYDIQPKNSQTTDPYQQYAQSQA